MKKIFTFLSFAAICSSCQVENINYTVPVMITYEPENVLTTSASLGGEALGEGGKDIIEYGMVWSTSDIPTINDTKVIRGNRIGQFYDTYTGFSPETTYYYRAYGINEKGIGYGETYSFTTQGLPPCNPTQNNRIYTGFWFDTITINNVQLSTGSDTWGDGNVEFKTSSNSNTIRIFAGFNEINSRLPLTGTYTVVYGFDSQSPKSVGEVELFIQNFGSQIGGAQAAIGQKIYLENNDGVITFIFCDTEFNEYYKLNGKFTYSN